MLNMTRSREYIRGACKGRWLGEGEGERDRDNVWLRTQMYPGSEIMRLFQNK